MTFVKKPFTFITFIFSVRKQYNNIKAGSKALRDQNAETIPKANKCHTYSLFPMYY